MYMSESAIGWSERYDWSRNVSGDLRTLTLDATPGPMADVAVHIGTAIAFFDQTGNGLLAAVDETMKSIENITAIRSKYVQCRWCGP